MAKNKLRTIAVLVVALTGFTSLTSMSLTSMPQGQTPPPVPRDTIPVDTILDDTLRPVIITPSGSLPVGVKKNEVIRVPTVSDVIGEKATDKIMHPFAFSRRKKDRHRRKMEKLLREYEQVKTPNEALIEAMRKEGINVDSLLELRKNKEQGVK